MMAKITSICYTVVDIKTSRIYEILTLRIYLKKTCGGAKWSVAWTKVEREPGCGKSFLRSWSKIFCWSLSSLEKLSGASGE